MCDEVCVDIFEYIEVLHSRRRRHGYFANINPLILKSAQPIFFKLFIEAEQHYNVAASQAKDSKTKSP